MKFIEFIYIGYSVVAKPQAVMRTYCDLKFIQIKRINRAQHPRQQRANTVIVIGHLSQWNYHLEPYLVCFFAGFCVIRC